ncbi:hypothetical protein ACFOW6_17375 [Fodinicurvata halophila]|uniref:Uncharacterized protein n=1 Tax=Fodinicurvata halophila TaxID=1419723 RepID=A0ABV8US82_9PROT
MTTKLHVNIHQGIIDVEGDPEFVKTVYADFKSTIVTKLEETTDYNSAPEPQQDTNLGAETAASKSKSGRRTKSSKSSSSGKSTNTKYSPKVDPKLEIEGLKEFKDKFKLSNNYTKILVFCKFLESKGISPCNADQIYTCFRALNEKLPKYFSQALYDTKNKPTYIQFETLDEISVTNIGENAFNYELERA